MRPRAEHAVALLAAALCAAACAGNADETAPPRKPETPAPVAPAAPEPPAVPAAPSVPATRAAPATPVGPLTPRKPQVRADCTPELITDTTSSARGMPARAGVLLVLAPHHHVYWKNPGDSGLPPTIEWKLPRGWTAGPIEWPAPRRIETAGMVTFGYGDEVLLPVPLTIGRDAELGEQTLSAHVRWLVCSEEACVSGDARLSVRFEVVDTATEPARKSNLEAMRAFVTTETRTGCVRPRPLDADAVSLDTSVTPWRLTVQFHAGTITADCTADFFPDEPLVLDSAAAPVLESSSGGQVVVRLTPAARVEPSVERLRGVLVLTTARDRVAYTIDVPRPR